MADIIRLLPDSVANQIAAGEVIQRPASVVKELVENAVDAGATEIKLIIKDAGKTLIQVVDNGFGMSETDARMAFERHATSKIQQADDLFNVCTKGFRGEALASIAAIAHVELKTRKESEELGTHIQVEGSKVLSQEPVSCPVGSNFSIKNLFYNTPARRKFLKGDSTEFRHIITEVQRVALVHPQIAFRVVNNDAELYNLPSTNYRQRIVGVFGKTINRELIRIETETTIVHIEGFIGKPEYAKKRSGDQYFFVNDRYFKSGYFHKAITNAYDSILQPGLHPTYFVYFQVDPKELDVNIHPTKTEIKFADATEIFQILQVVTKEGLGKFNIAPSLDFGEKGLIDIPTEKPSGTIEAPQISYDENYNPFDTTPKTNFSPPSGQATSYREKQNLDNWEQMYRDFEKENVIIPDDDEPLSAQEPENKQLTITEGEEETLQTSRRLYQFKRRYILTTVKSGLMMIDQRRAHERILYELFLEAMENKHGVMQQSLFPKHIELPADDAILLREISGDLKAAGFDIEELGQNSFMIQGTPADIGDLNIEDLIAHLIEHFKQTQTDVKLKVNEKVAVALAKTSAINYGRKLSSEEMQGLVDSLFACQIPNYSPEGKTAIVIFETDEIEKRFR